VLPALLAVPVTGDTARRAQFENSS